jgi:hypothetical protein
LSEEFTLLVLTFLGFTQSGSVEKRNRMTGAVMSLIKKSDAQKHCADRRSMRLVAARPVSQPNTAGRERIEPVGKRTSASGFIEDFFLEHTSSSASVSALK